MNNWKEELQKYLPEVEEFLTSVLLEETNINIADAGSAERENALGELKSSDIVLFARDNEHGSDMIVILDEEWYGLLSSIMLGVEEKTRNEITTDLLKKFSADFSEAILPKLETAGFKCDLEEIQVLTLAQVEKLLAHEAYFHAKLDVEGLADDNVRAELFLGDPARPLQEEEPEEETPAEAEPAADDEAMPGEDAETGEDTEQEDEFASVNPADMDSMAQRADVVNGRHIEFSEFNDDDETPQMVDARSMELLKDVEIDVSVELGRIELPLGKVLQLTKGSVIELEKLAGEPVDILVNGHCIAHGEVVVIDEHFGVRISNLITTRQRIAGLN